MENDDKIYIKAEIDASSVEDMLNMIDQNDMTEIVICIDINGEFSMNGGKVVALIIESVLSTASVVYDGAFLDCNTSGGDA